MAWAYTRSRYGETIFIDNNNVVWYPGKIATILDDKDRQIMKLTARLNAEQVMLKREKRITRHTIFPVTPRIRFYGSQQ